MALKLSNPVGRSTEEWIGKTADEPFPPRVRLRILHRYMDRCARCGREVRPGTHFTCDHIIAIINGGQNRETNGQPLCDWCNAAKNASDVTDKRKVANVSKKAYGLKQSRNPIPGGRRTKWRRRMDGTVERR